jgi:hypothetical protein
MSEKRFEPSEEAKAFAERVVEAFQSGEVGIELLPNDYPDAEPELESFAVHFAQYLDTDLANARMKY